MEKYLMAADWIREQILTGKVKPGERFMTEEELAARFSLSRQTIRRATGVLVNEGLLKRVHGSGTYVQEPGAKPDRKRTMNIAVISTYIDSYIFPPTIRGIEQTLSDAGYSVQIGLTYDDPANEAKVLKNLLMKDAVDGIITEPVMSALPNPNIPLYRKLMERNIPIICFNAFYPELDLPCVRLDDRAAAAEMTKLLLDAGHTKIGAIFHAEDGQGRLRYQGYAETLAEAEVPIPVGGVLWVDKTTFWNLESIADHVFDRLKDCTAVLCYSDGVALQLAFLAAKRGISADQLSIAGIDDSESSHSAIRIASYPHPKELLGRKAAENLLRMIEDPEYDGNYLFRTKAVRTDTIKERTKI